MVNKSLRTFARTHSLTVPLLIPVICRRPLPPPSPRGPIILPSWADPRSTKEAMATATLIGNRISTRRAFHLSASHRRKVAPGFAHRHSKSPAPYIPISPHYRRHSHTHPCLRHSHNRPYPFPGAAQDTHHRAPRPSNNSTDSSGVQRRRRSDLADRGDAQRARARQVDQALHSVLLVGVVAVLPRRRQRRCLGPRLPVSMTRQ